MRYLVVFLFLSSGLGAMPPEPVPEFVSITRVRHFLRDLDVAERRAAVTCKECVDLEISPTAMAPKTDSPSENPSENVAENVAENNSTTETSRTEDAAIPTLEEIGPYLTLDPEPQPESSSDPPPPASENLAEAKTPPAPPALPAAPPIAATPVAPATPAVLEMEPEGISPILTVANEEPKTGPETESSVIPASKTPEPTLVETPPINVATPETRPWGVLTGTVFLLLLSVSANIFLGWQLWDRRS